MQEVPDQHNFEWCMHDVPLFVWDIEARADHGVYAHSTSDFMDNKVNIAAKTLLGVILLGLVLTPRKFGTTRLRILEGPQHPDFDVPFHEEHVLRSP